MELNEIDKRVRSYMAAVRKVMKDRDRSGAADVISLDILENSLRQWLIALDVVERLGIVLESDRGNMSKNPAIDVANASLRQALAIMQDYGLTAISRKKLERGEAKTEDDNPLVEFFEGK